MGALEMTGNAGCIIALNKRETEQSVKIAAENNLGVNHDYTRKEKKRKKKSIQSNYQIILIIVAEYMLAVLGVGELVLFPCFLPTTKFTLVFCLKSSHFS